MKTYRDLLVWQKAMVLVTEIYGVSKAFPQVEAYGLTSQLRRCAVSIPSNMAEGYGMTFNTRLSPFLTDCGRFIVRIANPGRDCKKSRILRQKQGRATLCVEQRNRTNAQQLDTQAKIDTKSEGKMQNVQKKNSVPLCLCPFVSE